MFTRRALGGGPEATAAAYLICVSYGLSWPVAAAVDFDFHEVAFAPVLTAVALERLQAGRLRTALIALAALLLVKEDMGFLLAGIGIYLAAARPRAVGGRSTDWAGPRRGRTGLQRAGHDVLIPRSAAAPTTTGRTASWAITSRRSSGTSLSHPLSTFRMLITPGVKATTMAWLLAALCLLPLCRRSRWRRSRCWHERMLNRKFPNWWGTSFQYNAYLEIILVSRPSTPPPGWAGRPRPGSTSRTAAVSPRRRSSPAPEGGTRRAARRLACPGTLA